MTKIVPFLDLAAQFESIGDEVTEAVQSVMRSSQFILGEEVDRFEEEFADYCNTQHCVGVSSGTEALHLALRAAGIGAGDEVITAANSFVATPFAISYTGATPVFVDVDPVDYNIDVELIERAITPKTRAIVPVHLYGQPANMDAIVELADKHGLRVVEDACQSHGARLDGRRVGSLGDVGCFSFYPGKNLGAYGDGGAIVTNDASVAAQLRLLRNYGQREKNVHSMLGFNARLDTIQAAVLRIKLRHLDAWNGGRRAVAARYDEMLADVDVVCPSVRPDVDHVYHLYVIQHAQRDALSDHLRAQGVQCGIHYPHPLHHATPYQASRTVPEGVPVCTELAGKIMSLPIYAEMTEEQVDRVVEAVETFECAGVEA